MLSLSPSRAAQAKVLATLAAVLLLTWLAYLPGLSGPFLFDDFVNLDALGNYGVVDNWPVFWRYVTSGTADPLGRPIALLSFLLDARSWPADPAPFLRTNLLLHLLNGVLLFALLRRLGSVIDRSDPHNTSSALLGAGLWLLHPLFVSTTLYAVQREAMLPGTFMLAGLLAFVHGRIGLGLGRRGGLAWVLSGLVGGTVLASLSKANGLLLPLLALVIDYSVLQGLDDPTPASLLRWRNIRRALLIVPSLLLAAFLLAYLADLNAPLAARPWTIGQRMLTEPRVLLDYVRLLAVPRSLSGGLFNDGFPASTGLIAPWTTLPAIAALVAALVVGLRARRALPSLSAAILFFLGGHLLESTVVPLELYFEHRNYVPAMLAFWPLARGLWRLRLPPAFATAIAAAILLVLAVITHQRATLWGQPDRLAKIWALKNDGSPRSQVSAAILETQSGDPGAALRRLTPLWRERPYDLQVAFNYIDAKCTSGGLDAPEKSALADALRKTPRSELLTNQWLGNAIEEAASGGCRGLDLEDVDLWLQAALLNPVINQPRVRNQDIEPLLAQLALKRHAPDQALLHYNRALEAVPTPDVAARQASMLASEGAYTQALAHLDEFERLRPANPRKGRGMAAVHAKVLEWQGYWPREMSILRRKLQEAIRDTGGK